MNPEDLTKLGKFCCDHRWAYNVLRYAVLPVLSVWFICRDDLPKAWAEYSRTLKELDEDVAAYRAKQMKVTTPAIL